MRIQNRLPIKSWQIELVKEILETNLWRMNVYRSCFRKIEEREPNGFEKVKRKIQVGTFKNGKP